MEEIPNGALQRLRSNLEGVRDLVAQSVDRAGRPEGSVRLVAVTKSVPVQVASALAHLGQLDLGENRPEIAIPKIQALSALDPQPRWHMIGHYQGRKIRESLALFHQIHSVHDLRLLERIAARATALDRVQEVLLQINVSGEPTKQGFSPEEVPAALGLARLSPSLSVQGLMTMAPEGLPPDRIRRVFQGLRDLRDHLATRDLPLRELSMGMSGDFVEAILEGATMVRVGTALFEGLPNR